MYRRILASDVAGVRRFVGSAAGIASSYMANSHAILENPFCGNLSHPDCEHRVRHVRFFGIGFALILAEALGVQRLRDRAVHRLRGLRDVVWHVEK